MVATSTAGPHPGLAVLSTVRPNRLCVHIRGELDLATHDRLTAALETLDLESTSAPLHLHLARLDFCDSRGFEEIVRFTERVRRTGREITVDGARASLRRLVDLFDARDLLGS